MASSTLADIRAVTFDVGGTLIEAWPSVGHVYAEVAARHGCGPLSPELLTAYFHRAWKDKGAFDYSPAAWRRIVEQTFAGCTAQPVSDALFEALCARFLEPDAWRVYDDVRPTFERLARLGCKLGVVSNWDERLRPLLDRLELSRWFDVIVVSIEVGVTKPHPGIFQRALEQLALPGRAVLHVGDSLEEDVIGARKAGWHAWRLDRRAPGAGRTRVTDLRQVAERLERARRAVDK